MSPEEFIKKYIPYETKENGEITFKERDLQLFIQELLTTKMFYLFPVPKEVEIPVLLPAEEGRYAGVKMQTTTFRADLETLTHRYEVKRWLTSEKIKEAVGGLHLYHGHGSKVLKFFSKKWVVIGIAPVDLQAYKSAKNLAKAYEKLGVQVVFINENPNWQKETSTARQIKIAFGIGATIVLVAGMFGYSTMSALRSINHKPAVQSLR